MQAHTGAGIMAAVLVLAIAASLLTIAVSAFLLWRYRRAVARCMAEGEQSAGADAPLAGNADGTDPPAREFGGGAHYVDSAESADRLYRQTRSGLLRLGRRYGVAGGLCAVALGGATFLAFSQTQINWLGAARHPLQFVFLTLTFLWPALLTVHIVAVVPPLKQSLNFALYFGGLAATGLAMSLLATEESLQTYGLAIGAWSGESPVRLIAKWTAFNAAPTVLVVAFRSRRIRAVAPLVLAFMTVVSAGVMGVVVAAFVWIDVSAAIVGWAAETLDVRVGVALAGYFVLLCLAACAIFGALGWATLAWIRRGYVGKRISDQSLAVDALWVIFTAFCVVVAAAAGPGWALCAVGAFLLFRVAAAGRRLRPPWPRAASGYEPALLVLRVFALGNLSERLFDAVSRRWRHIGHVRLVAGMDLVRSTVAPHRFLAFVSGRLPSLFIGTHRDADRAGSTVDDQRDRDGRFRINDFFCRADTWKRVLHGLIRTTDVVLMDLRRLTPGNEGCVFEIRELLIAMPLSQVVFVVDDTTDKDFLHRTLDDACRRMPPHSPNWGTSPESVHPFELSSTRVSQVEHLIRRLCLAAARGERRRRIGPVGSGAGHPNRPVPNAVNTSVDGGH